MVKLRVVGVPSSGATDQREEQYESVGAYISPPTPQPPTLDWTSLVDTSSLCYTVRTYIGRSLPVPATNLKPSMHNFTFECTHNEGHILNGCW